MKPIKMNPIMLTMGSRVTLIASSRRKLNLVVLYQKRQKKKTNKFKKDYLLHNKYDSKSIH